MMGIPSYSPSGQAGWPQYQLSRTTCNPSAFQIADVEFSLPHDALFAIALYASNATVVLCVCYITVGCNTYREILLGHRRGDDL